MNDRHIPDETVTDEEMEQSIRTLHRLYGDKGVHRVHEVLRAIRKEDVAARAVEIDALRGELNRAA